jgi:hypothetical protein
MRTRFLVGPVAVIAALASVGWPGQERKPAQGKEPVLPVGSVSGRAYLITKGGDLKPVRDGAVYLIRVQPTEKLSLTGRANRMFTEMLKATEKSGESTSLPCVEVAAYREAAKVALKEQGSRTLETNAEGEFAINDIAMGGYDLVVIGHAGIYDAVWRSSIMVVGDKQTLKLNDPDPACSALR